MANISLAEATKVCDVAISKANDIGITIAVSVVDSGMNLVTMKKMDDTIILGIDGSRGKAVASVSWRLDRKDQQCVPS